MFNRQRSSDQLIDRRTILSSIAATTASASTITTTKAKRDEGFEAHIEQAIKIREESDDDRAWKKYLKAKNIKIQSVPVSKFFESSNENGGQDGVISPNAIHDVNGMGIDGELTLYSPGRHRRNYFAEFAFRVYICEDRTCDNRSYGENPNDSIGLAWSEDCWHIARPNLDDTSLRSDYVEYEDEAYGDGTFGFRVNDYQLTIQEQMNGLIDDDGYTSRRFYGGVYLDSFYGDESCPDEQNTGIWAMYQHAYTGSYSTFELGFSSGGFTLMYNNESSVEYDRTPTDKDGNELYVTV